MMIFFCCLIGDVWLTVNRKWLKSMINNMNNRLQMSIINDFFALYNHAKQFFCVRKNF